jgi:hypothetical protein
LFPESHSHLLRQFTVFFAGHAVTRIFASHTTQPIICFAGHAAQPIVCFAGHESRRSSTVLSLFLILFHSSLPVTTIWGFLFNYFLYVDFFVENPL